MATLAELPNTCGMMIGASSCYWVKLDFLLHPALQKQVPMCFTACHAMQMP